MKYALWFLLCLHHAMACSAALTREAEVFRAYCGGCHTLQYASPPHRVSMPNKDAEAWFGKVPPDLSMMVTIRGEAWLHDYLTGFYEDAHQMYGENNRLLPYLNMPNPFPMASSEKRELLIQDVVQFLSSVADPKAKERERVGYWILLWLFCLSIVLYGLYRLTSLSR